MILLAFTLLTVLIALGAWITFWIFDPRWSWFRTVMVVVTAIAIVMGILCGVCAGSINEEAQALKYEYKQLALYQDTISQSTNEYVRFDFYQKILTYNENYAQIQKTAQSVFTNAFVPKDWNAEIAIIEFPLNTGEYDNVENDYYGDIENDYAG